MRLSGTTASSCEWSIALRSTSSITSAAFNEASARAWFYWCEATTASSTSVTLERNDASWLAWSSAFTTVLTTAASNWADRNTLPQQATPEQVREDLRRMRRVNAEWRLARIRAERLLTNHLSREQQRDLKQHGFFKLYVNDKKGQSKIYRIRRGRSMNVDLVRELPGGVLEPIQTLCAHPEMMVPDADTMLVQKLMLETCEEEFLRIANKVNVPLAAQPARRAA